MRTVDYTQIVESVRQMCLEANTVLPPDVEEALAAAARAEESPVGRDVLRTVLEARPLPKQNLWLSVRTRAWSWYLQSWAKTCTSPVVS